MVSPPLFRIFPVPPPPRSLPPPLPHFSFPSPSPFLRQATRASIEAFASFEPPTSEVGVPFYLLRLIFFFFPLINVPSRPPRSLFFSFLPFFFCPIGLLFA